VELRDRSDEVSSTEECTQDGGVMGALSSRPTQVVDESMPPDEEGVPTVQPATAVAITHGLVPISDLRVLLVQSPIVQTSGDGDSTTSNPPSGGRRVSRPNPSKPMDEVLANPEYETTFRTMTNRRLLRKYHGTHKPSRLSFVLWSCAFLGIIAGFVTVSYQGTLSIKIDLSTGIFGILLPLVLLYIALRVVMIVRWCLFWLALGTVLLVLIDHGDVKGFERSWVSGAVVISMLSLQAITILAWLLLRRCYPLAVQRGWLCGSISRFYSIKPAGAGMPWQYVYKPPTTADCIHGARCTFTYDGEVDDCGRPHGWGSWSDSAPRGECLHGWWEEGLPVGPFRASEYGSDYVFAAVRIGFAHNRAETLHQKFRSVKFSPIGLVYGVCTVECSIAGHFFRHLPHCELLGGADGSKDAAWCLGMLKHMDHEFGESSALPSSLVVRADGDNIYVAGHQQECSSAKTIQIELVEDCCQPHSASTAAAPSTADFAATSSACVGNMSAASSARAGAEAPRSQEEARSGLKVHGWRPLRRDACDEALIFIPGFNASAAEALLALGQLLTLGDFPGHIKPFVFSWPTGGMFNYFEAVALGCTSETTVKDFTQMVSDLRGAGVTRLHILTHSMGARLVLAALPNLLKIMQPVESTAGGQDTIRLATCVLISPDAKQESFLAHDFDLLRSICSRITMYADERDWALFFSELFSRERTIGKHPFECCYGTPWPAGDAITASKSQRQPMFDDLLPTSRRTSSVGLQPLRLSKPQPLDMDIIDTSWMDSNVQTLRHSYFNVNRWLIDDIREAIVTCCRARERTGRLTHRRANVWSFLAAPRHVVAT